MSKVNDLAQGYMGILSAMGVKVNTDGSLTQTIGGVEQQLLVKDKPLTIPLDDVVKNYTDEIVLFHPLSENIMLGESPVLQQLRVIAMNHLTEQINKMVEVILKIAIDPETTKEMSPSQVDLLRCANGADANTLKNWQAVVRRTNTENPHTRVVSLFLKRGGELGGRSYKRVCVVNFDLYEKLTETDNKLQGFGVKLRKTDIQVLTRIFETIFPRIDEQDSYSIGSDSLIAPYFDALIRGFRSVNGALNLIGKQLKKPIKSITGESYEGKDDYLKSFEDLTVWRDVLPVMPLNDGDRNDRRQEVPPEPVQQPQVVQQQQPQPSPFYQQPAQPVQQPVYQQPQPVQQPTYQQPQQTAPVNVANSYPSLNQQMQQQAMMQQAMMQQAMMGGQMMPPPGFPFTTAAPPVSPTMQQMFNWQNQPQPNAGMWQNGVSGWNNTVPSARPGFPFRP